MLLYDGAPSPRGWTQSERCTRSPLCCTALVDAALPEVRSPAKKATWRRCYEGALSRLNHGRDQTALTVGSPRSSDLVVVIASPTSKDTPVTAAGLVEPSCHYKGSTHWHRRGPDPLRVMHRLVLTGAMGSLETMSGDRLGGLGWIAGAQ